MTPVAIRHDRAQRSRTNSRETPAGLANHQVLAHPTNYRRVGRYGHPVPGAWIDSMLPADANDPLLLAYSHAPHTGPAYAPLLICAVFDCRTNRLQRYCRAHRARLERQAPDAPRYIESGALPRSGCPNVSQSAADRRSTLEIDNRSSVRPERRKHAVEGRKSDCA